ncbi:AKAP7 2'5' RNA ligase-like domain-containing protein [Paraphoma chrysanthemicola]|uniref:AKAP7 2'5' RNA ligase-like domain-containing protein n=1 Tax=Paraphoma chrysanthemicola TaxID=798071 RepID=A0A8K0W1H3_9PLEO|nr:AKAP7 2'5' RNA ligase-like domain-containing protein [Paraphoma chrysanthemicola]
MLRVRNLCSFAGPVCVEKFSIHSPSRSRLRLSHIIRQTCLSTPPITTRSFTCTQTTIGRIFSPSKAPLRYFHHISVRYYHQSSHSKAPSRSSTMGKKKQTGEYNDFVDGEKLRDNAEIRTSLQPSITRQEFSPPPARHGPRGGKKHGRGGPKKPPLTHFLCLPLVTDSSRPQLEGGLSKLKAHLERSSPVPPKAIRPVGTLHLTLGVMSLDDQSLQAAQQDLQNLNLHNLLRDISTQAIAEKAAEDGTISENLNAAAMPDTDGLTVSLEGLVPMQEATKTSILYASPQDVTGRLMPFAQALRKRFVDGGWVLDEGRELKLHATIINTIYAKAGARGRGGKGKDASNKIGDGEMGLREQEPSIENTPKFDSDHDEKIDTTAGHGPNARSWLRFDARGLIEEFKDFTWADDVRIDRVQICKMGAKKVWSGHALGEGEVVDERYEVVCEKGWFV